MPDEACKWAEELGWLFDDEKFKPNSIAQIHPDVIRDGVRYVHRLLEQNEKLEADRRALVAFIVPFAEVAKEVMKWVHDDEHNEFERKIIKAWQVLGAELREEIDV